MSETNLIDFQPDVCWWCRGSADSREHKYKRSDIVREFGKPPYASDETPVILKDYGDRRQLHDVRGPNSSLARFATTLCGRCNDTRSQPFDAAYDRFVEYLREREDEIFETRCVDVGDVPIAGEK